MGTTTQTFVAVVEINPWVGLDEVQTVHSGVPRGEVRFSVINGVVSVPTAGDDGIIEIDCQFPQNFAYAYGEMSMKIAEDTGLTTNNWQNNGQILTISSSPRPTAKQQAFHNLQSPGEIMKLEGRSAEKIYAPVANTQLTYKADRNGANVEVKITVGNPTEDHGAALVNFFARYFMYDVEQANHYQVNAPTLVRSTH